MDCIPAGLIYYTSPIFLCGYNKLCIPCGFNCSHAAELTTGLSLCQPAVEAEEESTGTGAVYSDFRQITSAFLVAWLLHAGWPPAARTGLYRGSSGYEVSGKPEEKFE